MVATLALMVDGVVAQQFELEGELTRIGRAADNDIRIDDLAVSSYHAAIERVPNRYLEGVDDFFVRDLDSTNGTLVNGRAIDRVQIQPRDEVRIGWNHFKLMDDSGQPMDRTAYIVPE